MRVNYVIIFVSDMARSVRFYRDTLGLSLKFETSHWTEFATEGATMALHLGEVRGDGDRDDKRAGQARPGLAVPDLDGFHAQMEAGGVPCVQPPKDVFGSRVAQYTDPDGLIISVSEASNRG